MNLLYKIQRADNTSNAEITQRSCETLLEGHYKGCDNCQQFYLPYPIFPEHPGQQTGPVAI